LPFVTERNNKNIRAPVTLKCYNAFIRKRYLTSEVAAEYCYINNNNSAEGVEKSIGDPLAKHWQGNGFYLLNEKQ